MGLVRVPIRNPAGERTWVEIPVTLHGPPLPAPLIAWAGWFHDHVQLRWERP